MGGKRGSGAIGRRLAAGAAMVAASLVLSVAALAGGFAAEGAVCGPGADPAAPAQTGAAEIPPGLLPDFVGAAARFGLGPDGWAVLAAINRVESDFDDTSLQGVATGANAFGAAGPMQLGIGGAAGDTWAAYEVSGVPGGADPPSVYDEADAVYAAAAYLRATGAPGDWSAAIFAYNHADWYVREVDTLAAGYAEAGTGTVLATVGLGGACAGGGGGPGAVPGAPTVPGVRPSILPDGLATIPAGAPAAIRAMLAAGNRIAEEPYSFGGGHAPAAMGDPPDPAADPGEEENGGPGYDCSSAVDYVLWGAGLGGSLLAGQVPASGTLQSVGDPGPGRWVTIYAGTSGGEGHAFIAVDGLVLDTVHLEPTTPSGTGPRWQPIGEVARELASGSFVARHPPGI